MFRTKVDSARVAKKRKCRPGFPLGAARRAGMWSGVGRERGLHLLERLHFDLPYTLRRHAKFVSKLMQRHGATLGIVAQPAGFDDAAATGVERFQGLRKPLALKTVVFACLQALRGLGIGR